MTPQQPQPQAAPQGIAGGNHTQNPLNVAAMQQQQQPQQAQRFDPRQLDPALLKGLLAQAQLQEVAARNQREKVLRAGQPGSSVIAQLEQQLQQAQQPQEQQQQPQQPQMPPAAGIQQALMARMQQGQGQPQPQQPPVQHAAAGGVIRSIADIPTHQSFKEGGIVGYNGAKGSSVSSEDGPSALRLLVPAAIAGSASALAQLEALAPGLGYSSAGELIKDVSATAGKSVRGAMPAGPSGLLSKLGVVGALGGTAAKTYGTSTEDYRKRFGMETDDPSFAGDVTARLLGAASELGDIGTLGYAGQFYRDKQSEVKAAPAAPSQAQAMAQQRSGAIPTTGGVPAATSFRGTAMDPAQLAAMRASNDPEQMAAVAAYESWAKANPEQANAPRAAPPPAPPPYQSAAANSAPAPDAAPTPTPTAQAPAPSAMQSALEKYITDTLGANGEQARSDESARYGREVGAPDTSAQQAYLKDIERRRGELAPRSDFWSLAGHIASAPGGQQWWQSGVAGANAMQAANDKLAESRFALDKDKLTTAGGITELVRKGKEGSYAAGLKGRDQDVSSKEKAATAGASMYGTSKQAESSRYTADLHLAAAKAQAERAATTGDVAAERQALAEIKASLVADQATVAGVQKLGPMATEVDMENARRAAKRIQEATAYLHSKQVPGAAVPVAAVGGGAKFVSPPATGNVRP